VVAKSSTIDLALNARTTPMKRSASLDCQHALVVEGAVCNCIPGGVSKAQQLKISTDHQVHHAPNRIAFGRLLCFHGG
jgi:hypothetical protein